MTPEQLLEMVKTLLAERFGLTFYFEQRPLPVYALVVAERGVKGARPREGDPGGIDGARLDPRGACGDRPTR